MTCERHGNVIICGRRGGGKSLALGKCQECWIHEASVLCDGPRTPGATWSRKIPGSDKTCSKPLCRHCARHVDPDRDYCTEHADPATRRLAL